MHHPSTHSSRVGTQTHVCVCLFCNCLHGGWHSLLGCASGCASSTWISPVWLQRCDTHSHSITVQVTSRPQTGPAVWLSLSGLRLRGCSRPRSQGERLGRASPPTGLDSASAPKYRELRWVPAVCHERGGAPQYSMSQAYPRNYEEGSTQGWRPVA